MNPQVHTFEDLIALPELSSRTLTVDGYLTAPAVLARAGVFQYTADELGIGNRKGNDVVAVYRSADALSKAVESFESQTITLDHKWTTARNWRENAIGDVRDVEMRGEDMVGTLIIRDAAAIEAIGKSTKTQLSNGYSARLIAKPGTYKNQAYEYEQIDFYGNHTAVVDAARCGTKCRIGDSAVDEKETTMVTRNLDGLTVTFDNEQSAQIVDKTIRALDDSRRELTAVKAIIPKFKIGDKELDTPALQTLLDAKDAEIKKLNDATQTPEQIHALVVSRSNAIAQAKEMVPDLKIGDTDNSHRIRTAALDAVVAKDDFAKTMLDAALGTTKLADAKPEIVETVFNTIAAGLKKSIAARKVSDSRRQVGSLATASATDTPDPRQAWLDKQANAWKGNSKTEVN